MVRLDFTAHTPQPEQQWRVLAEAIPQIVWTAQPDGFLDFYNRRWFEYTGLTLEETQGWGWKPVLHPEDVQNCVAKWTHAVETGEAYEVEYRFKRAIDGAYRWHLGRALPVRDNLGGIVKWFGTCTDIHDEKELHRTQQRESQERLRLLVDSLKEHAVFMLDAAGLVQTWSAGAEAMKGYSASEIIGRPLATFYTLEDVQAGKPDALLQRAKRDGRAEDAGSRVRKDGSLLWVEVVLNSIRDSHGQLMGFAKVTRDVTARRLVELAAIAAKRNAEDARLRLATIVECSTDAIYSADSEGVIQTWNGGAEHLYGYSAREMIGSNADVLVPADGLAVFRGFLRVLKAGGTIAAEVKRIHKTGVTVESSLSLSPIRDSTGAVIEISVVARDIGPQKRAEHALQTSLAEKEILLREVHHRVKNNLQVISSLLSLQAREVTDPRALELFRASQMRVGSIALFHEQFYQSKDLGRIDIGTYLGDIANGLLVAHDVHPSRVRIVVDAEPMSLGVDAAIPCGLIVNELTTNAVKHAFPAGRAGTVKIVLRRQGETVSLSVADDGVGLRSDTETDSPRTLGMKLVRTLAQQLHATLAITFNSGTSFHLEFAVAGLLAPREAA